MKTNLDYYSRRTDAYRHPKFKTLRISYGGGSDGWAAEGRFWALNDIIADSEMCQIDLSKQRNKAVVADILGLSFEELKKFINILISPDIELLYEIEQDVYSTKKVKQILDSILVEREKARKRKGAPEKTESSTGNIKSSPEPNNRLKESKLKESKLKENRVKKNNPEDIMIGKTTINEKEVFFTKMYNSYFFEFINLLPFDIWCKWIEYRKETKHKLVESTAEAQLKKLLKLKELGSNPIDVINQSIENGWQGLFEVKLAKSIKPAPTDVYVESEEIKRIKELSRGGNNGCS